MGLWGYMVIGRYYATPFPLFSCLSCGLVSDVESFDVWNKTPSKSSLLRCKESTFSGKNACSRVNFPRDFASEMSIFSVRKCSEMSTFPGRNATNESTALSEKIRNLHSKKYPALMIMLSILTTYITFLRREF